MKKPKHEDGKKRKPSSKVNMQTTDPDVSVHASWPEGQEENIRVRAYPIDATGHRIPSVSEVSMIAKVPEDIPKVLDELKERVLEKMHPRKRTIKAKLSKGELDRDTPAVQTFLRLERSEIKIGRWGSGSQKKAMQHFRRNILSAIQYCSCDEDFGLEERAKLHKKLVDAALEHGNSKGKIIRAEAVADGHMADAGIIYGAMVTLNDELPYLSLLTGERKTIPQVEMIKMLPIGVHIRFRRIVEEAINTEPLYARGAALMDSGLRSSEAAAGLPEDMKDTGEYIVMHVRYQERNKKRDPILKTKASYRTVVLDDWATDTIRRANETIGTEGCEDAPIEGKELSAWVKNALIQAGCDEEFMQKAQRDMLLHPDIDANGNEIDDISAHVLRRHRITIQTVICGYSRQDVEVSAGHEIKITEAEKQSYKNKEKQDELAIKNRRYDINPAISKSAKHSAIKLTRGQHFEMKPFTEIKMDNTSGDTLQIELEADAVTIGETIEIVTSGEVISLTKRSTCTEKDKKYQNKDVIGDPWDYLNLENVVIGGNKDGK